MEQAGTDQETRNINNLQWDEALRVHVDICRLFIVNLTKHQNAEIGVPISWYFSKLTHHNWLAWIESGNGRVYHIQTYFRRNWIQGLTDKFHFEPLNRATAVILLNGTYVLPKKHVPASQIPAYMDSLNSLSPYTVLSNSFANLFSTYLHTHSCIPDDVDYLHRNLLEKYDIQ